MKLENKDISLLLKHIAIHVSLNEEEKQVFEEKLSFRFVKRKQVILREGEVCKYSTFVRNGCLRGYTIDGNGVEHVLNFAPSGWWMADMYSLTSRKPGLLYIEALEDSEIIQLSKDKQEELCKEIPKFEHFFRIIMENSLVSNQQRLMDSLSLSAEARYELFCKKYPMLIRSVPQKHIASYLGVTAEFFSKMKNGLIKKGKH